MSSSKIMGSIGILFLFLTTCQAFLSPAGANPKQKFHINNCPSPSRYESSTALAGGLFGGLGKKIEEPTPDLTIPMRVLEIPVQSLKKGGLRFVLGLHLIAQQGNPEKGSWRANQSSDTVLDMYFKDNSAMFSVVLEDSQISVDRYGQPSLQYLLQESVVLHSVLDELNSYAFDGEIAEESRLIQLEEPRDAIEKARGVLPARKA